MFLFHYRFTKLQFVFPLVKVSKMVYNRNTKKAGRRGAMAFDPEELQKRRQQRQEKRKKRQKRTVILLSA
jgi:hypothetical protein